MVGAAGGLQCEGKPGSGSKAFQTLGSPGQRRHIAGGGLCQRRAGSGSLVKFCTVSCTRVIHTPEVSCTHDMSMCWRALPPGLMERTVPWACLETVEDSEASGGRAGSGGEGQHPKGITRGTQLPFSFFPFSGGKRGSSCAVTENLWIFLL